MSRIAYSRVAGLALAVVGMLLAGDVAGSAAEGPYMATGLKIGEVTDSSAIVWTRLTLRPQPNPSDGPMVTIEYEESDAKSSSPRRSKRALEALVSSSSHRGSGASESTRVQASGR